MQSFHPSLIQFVVIRSTFKSHTTDNSTKVGGDEPQKNILTQCPVIYISAICFCCELQSELRDRPQRFSLPTHWSMKDLHINFSQMDYFDDSQLQLTKEIFWLIKLKVTARDVVSLRNLRTCYAWAITATKYPHISARSCGLSDKANFCRIVDSTRALVGIPEPGQRSFQHRSYVSQGGKPNPVELHELTGRFQLSWLLRSQELLFSCTASFNVCIATGEHSRFRLTADRFFKPGKLISFQFKVNNKIEISNFGLSISLSAGGKGICLTRQILSTGCSPEMSYFKFTSLAQMTN